MDKRWHHLLLLTIIILILIVCTRSNVSGQSVTALALNNTTSQSHVIINEIAWGGTAADTGHEWIELYNTTPNTITLENWQIISDDGSPDITLVSNIAPYGYYLIERNTDDVVADIAADIVTSFGLGLNNDGEILNLYDENHILMDSVNSDGGNWVNHEFGDTPFFQSLERRRPAEDAYDKNWMSNDGTHTINGVDANGNPISGTPRSINAATLQSPTEFVDLSLAMFGPTEIEANQRITYTLSVSYTGNITATNVKITDVLPPDVAFITQYSPHPISTTNTSITWSLGNVGAYTTHLNPITFTVSHETASMSNLLNRAIITSDRDDDDPSDNTASVTTTVVLPAFDPFGIEISGILYDGLQPADADEAVQLSNNNSTAVLLNGWQLCKQTANETDCTPLPEIFIGSEKNVWLTRDSDAFTLSFGHTPDYVIPDLPGLPNSTGAAVYITDDNALLIDTVVYGDMADSVSGWSGLNLLPYNISPAQNEGQILARRRDELTMLPVPDTNSAADWLQNPYAEPYQRQVLYPGWDTGTLSTPYQGASNSVVRIGIAPDNAFTLVYDTLQNAETSIEISMYTFTHPGIIELLADKARAGVNVRILLEGNPVATAIDSPKWQTQLYACATIEQAGGACYFMAHDPSRSIFNRYTYLHAKYMLIDREWLLITTQNLDYAGLPSDDKTNGTFGSRGYVLVTNAHDLVSHVATLFELDLDPANHSDIVRWNTTGTARFGQYNPSYIDLTQPDYISYTVDLHSPLSATLPITYELITAPDATLRQQDGLLGLINVTGAGDRIYVEQAYEYSNWGGQSLAITNPRLLALLDAARRGAQVRILLNGHGFGSTPSLPPDENATTVMMLNTIALSETLDLQANVGNPTGDSIHSKLVLVDFAVGEAVTHIGSINGSESSNKLNRELAIQITSDSVFDYIYRVFSKDWWLSNAIYLPLTTRNRNPHSLRADYVLISEVAYNESSAKEWVELYNPTITSVNLSGYHLGDAASKDDFESMFVFPEGTTIEANGLIVIAVSGAQTPQADFEFYENSTTIPNMIIDPNWGHPAYPFALHNDGDEILLLAPNYTPVDIVTYGIGEYPDVNPHPVVLTIGASLERYPIENDTDDCAIDFRERYPPTPGDLP